MNLGTGCCQLQREGRQESYLYKGDMNELVRDLAGYDIEDILIEEPALDEIFMHFYESESN